MTSDRTFITNEQGNTLSDRFDTLLRNDTRFFDSIVGYFFISGFYKLYPSLEGIEKIRILVGLQTDNTVFDLNQQARKQQDIEFASHLTAQKHVSNQVLRELEEAKDTLEIDKGVHRFIEWIRSGKLEIKAHPSQKLHAKIYIMTFKEGDRDKGRVITGSSNFTQSGLQDNLEFNVELKNSADYEFAIAKFNELWDSAIDLTKPYEDTVINRSPYAHFTPYELYLKFLYEYFKGELNRPTELDELYVPKGFMRLKYQEEAVLNARKILDEYGGAFLSDVVGLGKTYMAALLAQELDGRNLVIAPPHLLDRNKRGSWPNVFEDFQVRQTTFESLGKLESILEQDTSRYANVFIDESHRFRTETTQTYELLARICRGKRVILVSATPLNNTPRDILSQIKLFQNSKNSTIPNVRNLETFFGDLERNLKGLDRSTDRDAYLKAVQSNAKAIRENVLKYLMIRRTRNEISKYYGQDMASQNLRFPDVLDPQPLFYKLNKKENHVFSETVRLFATDFKYARYNPLEYYCGKDPNFRQLQGQRNLVRFIKVLLVKRLESSFHAFRLTLDRLAHSYEQVIDQFEKGQVYISKKHINKIFELLEYGEQEAIEQLIEEQKAERLPASDFQDEYVKYLKNDLDILHEVQTLWQGIDRDPKWLSFRDELQNEPGLKTGKLIVFTESKETAEYLAEHIRKEVDKKVLLFTGSSAEEDHKTVISNFDAKAMKPRDEYRILVSTEVLSEGVNLHRSNTVINYDIPWNPTRLIQRVGRVNRVDTTFDHIAIYNFFPSDEGNDLLKLKEAAEAKIHAFIEMLGADSRLLTEGEEIKSHDLFSKLNSKKTVTGEDEEVESELEYLTEIRNIRDKNPNLFERIKRLPKKARSTKQVATTDEGNVRELPSLLTYFRLGKLDKFFVVACNARNSAELDFIATAKILKPTDNEEARQTVPVDFYDLLVHNKQAFERATSIDLDDVTTTQKGASNDSYILKRLRARELKQYQGFTDEDEAYIQQTMQLLMDGGLPKPVTKKVAEALKKEIEPLRVLGILRRDIPPTYFQPTRAQNTPGVLSTREVILSSYLLGE